MFSIHRRLGAAIVAEVLATTALARSDGLTRLAPSVMAFPGYGVAFRLPSYPRRIMPTGIVHAIWSGLGIVLIAGVAWPWFGQGLDGPAVVGLTLILIGAAIVKMFSNSMPH